MMEAMQTNLLSNNTKVNPCNMPDIIDHTEICQWLKAIADNRDKHAFTLLFKFFAPKIKNIVRSKFPNEDQASEVVQETMSNIWRKAHLYNADKGAPTTWVYTVMRNVTFDLLRKVKGNKEDNLSEDIWHVVENQHVDNESFDDHIENKNLLDVIENLPEAQQQVVKGYYLMEMSQEQLAQELNLPLGTIKSRLRLALAKLKTRLGENHD
jgi:RNA polymerase sigma-70 factor (ECF subfamily)